MKIKEQISKRAMEIVLWSDVKFLTDEIEELIGSTETYHLNYTDDMQKCVEEIKMLFEQAHDKASDEIMDEIDKEQENF